MSSFGGGRQQQTPLVSDGCGATFPWLRSALASDCRVFELSPDDTETVLHTFEGGADGALPEGALIADNAGNLYGTTPKGGVHNRGTVFMVTPKVKEKVLDAFKRGNDGDYPHCTLILDKVGNLYGTTEKGGAANVGTVFKFAPDGTEAVFYAFKGGSDGAWPVGGLIADSAGNFYGTTNEDGGTGCGDVGCGTEFKLAPDGTETVHSLNYGSDGAEPWAALTMDRADLKGALLGTAPGGGAQTQGSIFSIKK